MKKCPQCNRDYNDDSLSFCLDDGSELLFGAATDEPATAILSEPRAVATGFPASDGQTQSQIQTTDQTAILHTGANVDSQKNFSGSAEKQSLYKTRVQRRLIAAVAMIIILLGGFFGYRYFGSSTRQIESIAVMPFANESGNPDVEYL